MSQPSLADEGQIEEYGGDYTPRDEERFQSERSNVADVGDVLVCGHGGIVGAADGISKYEAGSVRHV